MRLSSSVATAVVLAGLQGCSGCGDEPTPPGGAVCGAGTVDGEDYKVDTAELVITVAKADGFGCGALHSHVVLAKQATFSWELGADAAGEVAIVVGAAGLDPDDAALRKKYLPEGVNQPLSDGDRDSIRGSVLEEVLADEHPALTFVLKNLTTIDGEGTATLVSTIAGADSEVDVAYTATKDGDVVNLVGSAIIPGGPHGIPRNALGFCVDPNMGLAFTMALSPGTQTCDGTVEEVKPFVPTEFPDEACGDVGFNVVYNNVVGPRCAGCHGGTLPNDPSLYRGGATVPLFNWDHFRVDSVRNPGAPLYVKAHEYVGLDPNDVEVLSMPPSAFGEATPLQQLVEPVVIAGVTYTTEKDLFDAWVTVGQGRNTQCADDVAKKTFGLNDGQRVEPGDACGGLAYDTPQATHEGASAKDFFESRCMYCHANGDPGQAFSAPAVGTLVDADTGTYTTDFAAGNLEVTHPFYVDSDSTPLSFWEASIHRAEDGSMYPGAGVFDDGTGRIVNAFEGPQFDAFKAWVAAGYCASNVD